MPRALRPASRAVAVLALLVTLGVSLGRAPAGATRAGGEWQSVVVQAAPGDRSPAEFVRRVGGTVTVELPIVSGFAARVPAASVPALQALPGVRAVTPDHRVHVAASGTSSTTVNSVFAREVNADRLWAEGVKGTGVRVALVDTGVSPVRDVADRLVQVQDPARSDGALVDCVNFSGEDGCQDSYGHGTFVAGLIAGTGAASDGRFRGVAPRAELISLKIAGRDGSSDVSKVLAAIQWVVSFADRYGIRVLNLSLGTDSTAGYRHDPLNYAVERAWRSGIAVVVSASNRGPGAGTISKPADDPFVITVGAVDDRGTPGVDDDRLPRFSGRGPTVDGLAKPDVTAPGARVVSLRSPGSHVEAMAPGGGVDATYRRGSGTSMSAALVSGVAALVLQANRDWSPDRLKFALTATARPVADDDPMAVGAGMVDAQAARVAPYGLANQGVPPSDGTASLEASRGSVRVCPVDQLAPTVCDLLRGEQTAQGVDWNASVFISSDWTGSSWYGGQGTVSGSSWYGSSWYGSSWYGSSWYGSSWYGTSEDDTSYGVSVEGSSWYGAWD